MKSKLLAAIFIFVSFTVKSQTIKYFEFRQPLGSTNTFTSFIVATSDPIVINDVLNDITLPVDDRRFISGNVTNGSAGFNHDGTNWYSWHYIINEWQLTTANVEHCDGISSAIGNHPSVIAGDTIYFCPWTSYPAQEIDNPALTTEDTNSNIQITIYPNPSSDKIFFEWASTNSLSIDMYNITGQHVFSTKLLKQKNAIEVNSLSEGLYFLHIVDGNKKGVEKIIVEH
jgi:hypothetical protein